MHPRAWLIAMALAALACQRANPAYMIGPATRLLVGPDRQTPMVLAGTSLAAHGRTDGAAFDDPCPAGQVARGGIIRAGAWIDGFTLICGMPAGVP